MNNNDDIITRLNDVRGRIIVFNAILRMLPRLSPTKVFRSQEHLKEVSAAVMQYNERLEEELENLEDRLADEHPEAA